METEASPYIRFRLGNIDSYQAPPTNLDREDFGKVPIIRIWGAADESGQKVHTLSLDVNLTNALSARYAVMFMGSIRIAMWNIREI